MSSSHGWLKLERMMKTAQAIFRIANEEIKFPDKHIGIRCSGGSSFEVVAIELQRILFAMLCQQLTPLCPDRAFAFLTRHRADERHLLHHPLVQCGLVLRV